MESEKPSADQISRKERSLKILKEKNIPAIAHLPMIESEAATTLRATTTIAERLIGCTICAVGGETGDRKFIDQLLSDFAAAPFLSPKEKLFLDTKLTDQHERTQFSWRYERSWVLLWALGYFDELAFPSAICDVPKLASTLRNQTVATLVANAKPRSKKELLDAADLIYRIHWAVTDARINNRPSQANVDSGVVMERHAALNWLIGYMDQNWDEITTDT